MVVNAVNIYPIQPDIYQMEDRNLKQYDQKADQNEEAKVTDQWKRVSRKEEGIRREFITIRVADKRKS